MNSAFNPQFTNQRKRSKTAFTRDIKHFPNVSKISSLQNLSRTDLDKENATLKPLETIDSCSNQDEETQKHCVICSGIILRQVTNSIQHWYCPRCHENLSDDLIFAMDRIKSSSPKDAVRYFRNSSRYIKVIQFQDRALGFQERVVFPGQTIFLNPSPLTCINVNSGDQITCLMSDTIPCEQLPKAEFNPEELPQVLSQTS